MFHSGIYISSPTKKVSVNKFLYQLFFGGCRWSSRNTQKSDMHDISTQLLFDVENCEIKYLNGSIRPEFGVDKRGVM